MPKVSIVLPTYNGEEYIKNSIDSILNQTYTNWELIIVNDCSKDNTAQIIQEYANKDSRIKVITNETNKKLPASLNIGFEKATGDYYTWTSDDNEYYPQAIEKMVNFLENNKDFGMVYARENVEENGVLQDYIWCDQPTTPETLLKLCVPGACFCYRSNVAKTIGKYDENCFLNEDHDYWLRILQQFNIYNLKDVLYLYRLTNSNLTSTNKDKIRAGKIKLLRKYREIYANIFPEVRVIFKNQLIFDKYTNNEINFKECKKSIKTSKLYKLLKEEYRAYKNPKFLQNIMELGFPYIFCALYLFLKQTTKKK